MSRKNRQLVSLTETLREFKALSELTISRISSVSGLDKDINSKFDDGDMIAGGFKYEDVGFTFIDRCSDDMGLHRLSCQFTFDLEDLNTNLSKTSIQSAIKRFELLKIGIKAIELDADEKKFVISFCIDMISSGDKKIVDRDSVISYIKILKTSADFFWALYEKSTKDLNDK
ncbi:hypothetical protein [Enterobacter chuandaensis]|uniref:hypothetical protein n=1 Tax=Enterobacter chuandaensis TaxID=2497875 RepID=UPI000E7725B2|nr:hypothetical protein [Enterobacter chuandaensis]RJL02697.1 hypothetical protein D5066_09115 [Enterobacter chuandaensis]